MNRIDLSTTGLLTLSEAAARLNAHERTVRRWTQLPAGALPYVAVGGSDRPGYLLFRAADLDAWTPPRGPGAPAGNRNAKKKDSPKPTKQGVSKKTRKKSRNP